MLLILRWLLIFCLNLILTCKNLAVIAIFFVFLKYHKELSEIFSVHLKKCNILKCSPLNLIKVLICSAVIRQFVMMVGMTYINKTF